jgi:epoxide hydrolase
VAAEPVTVLIGVAVFGQDRGLPIRKFAEPDSTITHWSGFDRGGHFTAMEQPELYVGDLRTFVGSLDGR